MPTSKFLPAFVFLIIVAALSRGEDEVLIDELVMVDSSDLDRSSRGETVSYAESLDKARPSVVSVYSRTLGSEEMEEQGLLGQLFDMLPQTPFPFFGLGSGVIVTENGYVLTNNHVVSGADEIQVQLDNQRIYDAVLVGTDPQTDVAVLKIEETGLPVAILANSDQIHVGDVVFAIGNPLGVGKTVTMGIVSATKRQEMGVIAGGFEDFIQTDASINTGNSGGALVDARGRLIGINTLIQTDGRSSGNIGIGFAIPVNLAYSVMKDLIQEGAVSRGFLGVGIESLDEELAGELGLEQLHGALVNQVNDGTPAAQEGIRVGDLIVSVDGEKVDSPSDLRIKIAARKPGDVVTLAIVRKDQRFDLSVVLAERGQLALAMPTPSVEEEVESEPRDHFLEGIEVEALSDAVRSELEIDATVEGIVVSSVSADSPFSDTLPKGMVIQKVNGQFVSSPEEAMAALKSGQKNVFMVSYKGVYRWVSILAD